jgi:hypothetical protein
MVIEAGFAWLVFQSWRKAVKQGGLTPERETMYLEAMDGIRGENAPELFRKLAEGFEKYGCPVQAKNLRTRADYLGASEDVKQQRKDIIRRAMASTNVEAIMAVAYQFEQLTATGTARDLRKHADDVREGRFPPEIQEKEKSA